MVFTAAGLAIGAAKFVGSMVAWEVGTRALEYGMDKYNEEDSIEQPQAESKIGPEYDDYGNYIGEMGLLGASVGTAYGGKKMYGNFKNKAYGNGKKNPNVLSTQYSHQKASTLPNGKKLGTLTKHRDKKKYGSIPSSNKRGVEPITNTVFNKKPIDDSMFTMGNNQAPSRNKATTPNTRETGRMHGPGNSAWVKVNPNTKSGKKVFKWASKYVKSRKLKIALMGLGLVGTVAGVLKSKPSNQMGDTMVKAMAINKGFQDTIEPELGIDYMSKIQHNLAKKLSSLLEESTISEEGIDSLMNTAEADIHDKFMETVTNSFQMFMKNGSPEAMNNSAKELQALKKGKRLISEQTDIIRGTGTVEDKNKARNKIVQLKDLVFSFGDQNKSLESAIKLGLDYQRNIVAMRSMLGRTGVTGTAGKTKIDTGKLQLLHQLLMEWDTYSEEEQTALESTKTYLENLVPSTEGGWGGLTLKDMARQNF